MDPVITPNSPEELTPATNETRAPILAPIWHTVTMLIVILAFSALGAVSNHPVAKSGGKIPQYLLTMAWEWILFGFVIWGVRKSGVTLKELVGGRWQHSEDFLLDVAIAIGFWIVSAMVLLAVAYAV